jgi:hypothetical protein
MDSKRATGRTTRVLKAIPRGCMFVITHGAMKSLVEDYLERLGRSNDFINIVTLDDLPKLVGTTTSAIGIDHTASEAMTEDEWILLFTMSRFLVTTDSDGDVITTFMP